MRTTAAGKREDGCRSRAECLLAFHCPGKFRRASRKRRQRRHRMESPSILRLRLSTFARSFRGAGKFWRVEKKTRRATRITFGQPVAVDAEYRCLLGAE